MLFYIVNLNYPPAPIKELDLEVKVCKKTVWGIAKNGRRYLIGASAFQTLPSAERCRRGALEKLVESSWQKMFRYHTWEAANKALTLH